MASFAKIGLNGKVIEVQSISNKVLQDAKGVEQEKLGIDFLTETQGSVWLIWVSSITLLVSSCIAIT